MVGFERTLIDFVGRIDAEAVVFDRLNVKSFDVGELEQLGEVHKGERTVIVGVDNCQTVLCDL